MPSNELFLLLRLEALAAERMHFPAFSGLLCMMIEQDKDMHSSEYCGVNVNCERALPKPVADERFKKSTTRKCSKAVLSPAHGL